MNISSTTFDDDTIIDFVKTASRVAFASAAAIGIPGNLFVLFAILYSRDLRTVSNIFIFNLALADLLFLMGVPILIIQSVKGEWIFGPIVCKLYLASSGVNQFASATFMAVLSFDRYLAVCHAVRSTRWRTRTFALILVLISWIIVLIEIIPLIKFSKMIKRPNRFNTSMTCSCTLYWGDMDKFDQLFPVSRRIFTTYSFTLSYLIPLIGVWYFYSKIIILVWLRRSRFWAQRHRLRRTTTKVTVMGLAIVFSYTVFYLPFWIVQWSIETEASWMMKKPLRMLLSYFSFSLLYFNSALNPFLCVFFTDTFIQKVFRRNADPYGASFNPSRNKTRNFKSPIYSPVSLANGRIVIPSARDDVTL